MNIEELVNLDTQGVSDRLEAVHKKMQEWNKLPSLQAISGDGLKQIREIDKEMSAIKREMDIISAKLDEFKQQIDEAKK